MADWDSIIKYYQEKSHFPRYDAEIWEDLRHHSREMLVLIPQIRQHPELQKLNALIDVNHLLLSNSETNRIASVWIGFHFLPSLPFASCTCSYPTLRTNILSRKASIAAASAS